MPKAFERCVKQGGRVRTVKISKTKYRHICCEGKKCVSGHVKTKKENK